MHCKVKGFERTWSASVDLKANNIVHNPKITGVTAVSVQAKEGAECNGVVVKIDPRELPAFDKREAGYERTRLQPHAIVLHSREDRASFPVETAQCWLYVHPPGAPTAAFPVLQSYLDVMLLGCEEYGEEFAEEFLSTTTGWGAGDTSAFLDDRKAPGYLRASVEAAAKAAHWDDLLRRLAPAALESRVELS